MESEGANTDILKGSIKSASYHMILQVKQQSIIFKTNK